MTNPMSCVETVESAFHARSARAAKRILAGAVLPLLALFLALTPVAHAQLTAQLNGRVTDSTGAAVPGATVTVSNPSRGTTVTVVTNESGDYVIPLLQPDDHYRISVKRDGFKETVQNNVVLQIAQTAKIDVIVQPGSKGEEITVSSGPALLDTQTSSLGQVITGQTVQDLPLNGRSTFRLIELTPGVVFNQSAYGQFGDVAVNSTFDTNFSINGGRAQANEILIDGVPTAVGYFNQITTMPTPDDTQEFKVESNNLPAQYGRYAGGAVNVSTKAGENRVHGTIFEFIRNSALDANDFFNKAAGAPIPPFKMNQFGGVVGGPVWIPKIYNGHDRTFFFLEYQGTRRIKGTPFNTFVPTDAQRAGDFRGPGVSGAAVNIYNPFLTNTTTHARTTLFSYLGNNNVIDPALIDPVAQKILQYFPEPNCVPTVTCPAGNNFHSAASVRVMQDLFSVRIDQNVTQKYHLFARYAYSNTGLTQPNQFNNIADHNPGAVGTTSFKNQSGAFDNIYTITPNLVLSVDYGFARWYQIRQTLSYGFDISTLGFPAGYANAVGIKMFPAINISQGYAQLANQSYLNNGNDSHAILSNLTWLHGRHQIIMGFDGRLHRINFFNVANSTGVFSFTQAQTQGPNAQTASATAGDAFASFLIGDGNSGSVPLGSGVETQNFYGAVYIQDNWRVTEKLTVNLGLRYDGETPYTDRHNELNWFDPNVASPAANPTYPNLTGGLVFAGVGGQPRTVYTRQHANIGPRLGFAFNPQPSTVIRGGFGIAYAPLEVSNAATGFSPSLGYASSTTWNTSNTSGDTPANLLKNPYPSGLVQPLGNSQGAATQLGQALTVWDRNPQTPSTYQWNLDVQQQMPGAILFDIGYSGSRGLHLTNPLELNQLNDTYTKTLGAGLTAGVPNPFGFLNLIGALAPTNPNITKAQALRPFPQFLGITDINAAYGESTYHSMQVKFVKRRTHGLTMLGSYTWSKLISNVNAEDAAIGTSDNTGTQDANDLRAERSVSELDIPNIFKFNATYELPFGRGKMLLGHINSFGDKFIGGWKMTAIWTEMSGLPLTFTTTTTGITNARPNNPTIPLAIAGSRNNRKRVGLGCSPKTDATCGWFNATAFNATTYPGVNPAIYNFGTMRRTYTGLRGPGVQNLDTSLIKDTKVYALNTEFRAEFFNVTNTPHFGMPTMALPNAALGSISGVIASPPQRQIQFAFKISF